MGVLFTQVARQIAGETPCSHPRACLTSAVLRGEGMFLTLATRRDVVARALKTALLVGSILIVINHGDALLAGDVGAARIVKILLTFLVPYCVSTYAGVAALLSVELQPDAMKED